MADFTPAEEVERILMAPWEKAEKVVRDFFREEWVEDPGLTTLTVGLAVVVVLWDGQMAFKEEEAVEVEGDTLVEAVEIINLTPVEEGEGLSTQEKISRTNVATTQLVMVVWPLHFCRKIKTRATTNWLQK